MQSNEKKLKWEMIYGMSISCMCEKGICEDSFNNNRFIFRQNYALMFLKTQTSEGVSFFLT